MRAEVLLDEDHVRHVRDYAAGLNDPSFSPPPRGEGSGVGASRADVEAGMAAVSEKFKALGEQVYVDAEKVKESNKVS